MNLIAAIQWSKREPVCNDGGRSPGINCVLRPRRHRDSADTAVLPDQIDDAPAAVSHLDVFDGE